MQSKDPPLSLREMVADFGGRGLSTIANSLKATTDPPKPNTNKGVPPMMEVVIDVNNGLNGLTK